MVYWLLDSKSKHHWQILFLGREVGAGGGSGGNLENKKHVVRVPHVQLLSHTLVAQSGWQDELHTGGETALRPQIFHLSNLFNDHFANRTACKALGKLSHC